MTRCFQAQRNAYEAVAYPAKRFVPPGPLTLADFEAPGQIGSCGRGLVVNGFLYGIEAFLQPADLWRVSRRRFRRHGGLIVGLFGLLHGVGSTFHVYHGLSRFTTRRKINALPHVIPEHRRPCDRN